MTSIRLIRVAIIILLTAPTILAGTQRISTEHYDLWLECPDLKPIDANNDELLRTSAWLDCPDPGQVKILVEQLHAVLARFFGTAPRERLHVKIFLSQDSYRTSLRADGVYDNTVGEAGGCYAPQSRTAYLWGHRSDEIRSSIIHECTHQFHWIARTGNAGPSSHYYEEGVAEYFAKHRWDGKSLHIGRPTVHARRETSSTLKARFSRVWQRDLRRIATTSESVPWGNYDDAWGLVAFLIDLDQELFFKWADKLDRGIDPVVAWDSTFGKLGQQMNQRYEQWLIRQESPVDIITDTSDVHHPGQIVMGTSRARAAMVECKPEYHSFAIALLNGPTRKMFAVAELDRGATAGIIFGYRSEADFSMVRFNDRSVVELVELRGGEQTAYSRVLARVPQRADRKYFMQLCVSEAQGRFCLNGVEVGRFNFADGEVGLLADTAPVRFENVTVDEADALPVLRPPESTRLSDAASRFSLEACPSWTRANSFAEQVVLNGPKLPSELRAPSIVAMSQVVAHDAPASTLEQLWELQLRQIKLEGGEVLETDDALLDKVPAKKTTFVVRERHRTLHNVALIAIHQNVLHAIAFVGTPEQFQRLRDDVQLTFTSFRLNSH